MAIALLILTIGIYPTVTIAQRRVRDRINEFDRERFHHELDRLKALEDEDTVIFLTRNHAPSGPRPSEFSTVSGAV